MHPDSWGLPFGLLWLALFGIVLARAGGTYLIGRLAATGARKLRRLERMLASEKYARAEGLINKWGAPVVALSFLTIGFQTIMNLTAGTTRMPLVRYVPALVLGGAAWALVYATVGFVGIEAYLRAHAAAPVATVVLTVVFVLALLGLLAAVLLRRRGVSPSAPPAGSRTGQDAPADASGEGDPETLPHDSDDASRTPAPAPPSSHLDQD